LRTTPFSFGRGVVGARCQIAARFGVLLGLLRVIESGFEVRDLGDSGLRVREPEVLVVPHRDRHVLVSQDARHDLQRDLVPPHPCRRGTAQGVEVDRSLRGTDSVDLCAFQDAVERVSRVAAA